MVGAAEELPAEAEATIKGQGQGYKLKSRLVLPPVLHQMWGGATVRACNEVLAGELQAEVDLLQEVEANWRDDADSAEGELEVVRVPYNLDTGHQHSTTEEGDGERGAR